MSKTLGGSLFFNNPESQDYCWREAIRCLQAMCDEVVVLDAGSDDGSQDLVMEFVNEETKIVRLPASEWNKMRGKEKLSHYTNVAKVLLTTEWQFNLQADESVASWCFPFIRQAIERDEETFFCTRINMWGNSKHQLNVDHSRTPVGTK